MPSNRQLKSKKCRVEDCRKPFTPWNSTQVVCSPKCALELLSQRKQEKFRKETHQRKKDFLAKDRPHQIKLAQKAFNAYIRFRDKDKPCISCGTTNPNLNYDCGHYLTIGAHPEHRFNPDNAHRQCHYNCNINRSGNVAAYRLGLLDRIGEDRLNALESKTENKKMALEAIKSITRVYKTKLNKLKSLDG